MELPGGYLRGDVLLRELEFAPIDGHFELALAELALAGGPAGRGTAIALPRLVSQVLARAIDAPAEAALEIARALSVADRQYLIRALASRLGMDRLWLTGACRQCGERFDVDIVQSALPVKPAGAGYPFTTVELPQGSVRVRAPNGADQEALAFASDADAARALLLRRVTADAVVDLEALPLIEQAIEAMAPEVAEEATSNCPQCGHENRLFVDPYACLYLAGDALFDEVHRLASAYHWSEREILDLPRARRHRYLGLIDRSATPVHAPTYLGAPA